MKNERIGVGLLSFVALPLLSACSAGSDEPGDMLQLGTARAELTGCSAQHLSVASAYASSVEANHYIASWAVDGNSGTRWASVAGAPQWLVLDLGGERFIDTVTIHWEAAYSTNYDIQVSNNGINWSTVQSVPNANGGVDVLSGLDATARYVRIFSHAGNPLYGISIYEVEVLGDQDPTCGGGSVALTSCADSVPVSLSDAVASSQEASYLKASKAIDGDFSTRWGSAFVDNAWIRVNLGGVTEVNSVHIYWEAAYSTAYTIQTAMSASGPWTVVYSNSSGDGSVDEIEGLDVQAHYLRVVSTDRATIYGHSIYELQVFGSACGPTRSRDGSGNNLGSPAIGSAGSHLRRLVGPDFGDGISSLAGADRPSARVVSNEVHAQSASHLNPFGASDFIWQWGQFVDHDIDLTPENDPLEPAPISVPAGDPYFDPDNTGTQEIGFNRSIYDPETGTDPANPRQQLNLITAWLDGSQVYGSDEVRAAALRTNDGTGRLATSDGNLLPFNTFALPNAGGPSSSLFLAGDVRANEQNALTAMHTLFMREHNRYVSLLQEQDLTGDERYQAGRKWVGALIQSITYNEYLPALLGPYAPSRDSVYDDNVDSQIINVFATALFRMGHSQLSATLLRRDQNGGEIAAGDLSLANAFFNPQEISAEGIEPLLRGLATQEAQAIDVFLVDEVRNFLFGPPGAGGFDLASLNIQRGRDHGLPSYNDVRSQLGLAPASDYDSISSDPVIQARLEAAYGAGNVDEVDAWTGGLAEDPLPGAHTGELITEVLVRQFTAMRDGDRDYYRRALAPELVEQVEATTLADVIRRNTSIGSELQDNVFLAP